MNGNYFLKLFAAGAVLASVLFSQNFLASRIPPERQGEERKGNQTIASAKDERAFEEALAGAIPPASFPAEKSPGFIPADGAAEKKSDALAEPPPPARALAAPPEAKRVFSDEEIFRIQHPESYLNYLGSLEDLMAADGFLEKDAKREFGSEDAVLSFWRDQAFDYLAGAGVFNEGERERFYSGLAFVKALHKQESVGLRAGASSPAVSVNTFAAVANKIADFLRTKAEAQTCFASGAAKAGVGTNLTAPCCACRGPHAVPLGCLNAVCAGRPAIYDPTNFICGCGI